MSEFNSKNFKSKMFLFVFLALMTLNVFADNETTFSKNTTYEKQSLSEFPADLFTLKQKRCGAIILHIIFGIYCFGAIALVCSTRFLPTINCICTDLQLSDDVAAATFMSIATSTPELFSNIIGTFITESDIGIGHVVGNGYYNMFFVAFVGGLVATKEIVLDWWSLTRDCGIYSLVALVLTAIVWDGVVQLHETVILLLLYFVYFYIMFNNNKIRNVIFPKLNTEKTNSNSQNEMSKFGSSLNATNENLQGKGDLVETESLNPEHDCTLPPRLDNSSSETGNKSWNIVKKIFTMPINFLIRYTVPDVRIASLRKFYPLAFINCIAWTGVSTYLGTWMVSLIGETIGVPDLIMGMVFMAAGGSVIETYSVYYKSKRGECSIGLSNSIGCNNIDATLCLALPWLIKTLPIKNPVSKDGSFNVILESSLIQFNCLLLVISTFVLYAIFYLNKFRLNKKQGYICLGVYILVLCLGISIEKYSKTE